MAKERNENRARRLSLVQLVEALALNLVHEVKVTLVEVVDTDVTVLTTGSVRLAGGVGGDSVLRAITISTVSKSMPLKRNIQLTRGPK